MTNRKLRIFTENILYWQIKSITQNTNWERDRRVWLKLEQPVWHQLEVSIAIATRNTIRKQK